jgi:hypothetical protein
MLNEQRRKQLDGIVQQMTANREPDANIQFVVNDFKKKYENEASRPSEPKKNPLQKVAGFLGIEKAGQGLATAGRVLSGSINQSGDEEGAATQQLDGILRACFRSPGRS